MERNFKAISCKDGLNGTNSWDELLGRPAVRHNFPSRAALFKKCEWRGTHDLLALEVIHVTM